MVKLLIASRTLVKFSQIFVNLPISRTAILALPLETQTPKIFFGVISIQLLGKCTLCGVA
jgi:hypothetical protein